MIATPRWFRMPAAATALITAVACAAHHPPAAEKVPAADSAPVIASPAATPPEGSDWLTADTANHMTTIALEVTALPDAPSAVINGHRNGGVKIVVPVGWTVRWTWRNADPTARHSLVVMVQREKVPLEGGRPAFSNAMTRMVTEGLPPGQTDETTFVAEETGWYWLMCGVPSHALAGEWIELRVDPEAKLPSVKGKKREQ